MSGDASDQGPQLSQADLDALTRAGGGAVGSNGATPAETTPGDPAPAGQVGGTTKAVSADAAAGEVVPVAPAVEKAAAVMGTAIAAAPAAASEAGAAGSVAGGVEEAVPPPPLQGRALDLPDFAVAGARPAENNIDLLNDVELDVKIELGRAQMLIEDVLRLGEGVVVELDKLAGDPVDVLVNDRLVARGEVLVLNDSFCVRINEVLPGIGSEEAA
jgi:flagellar motor switch protein FliN/FliY